MTASLTKLSPLPPPIATPLFRWGHVDPPPSYDSRSSRSAFRCAIFSSSVSLGDSRRKVYSYLVDWYGRSIAQNTASAPGAISVQTKGGSYQFARRSTPRIKMVSVELSDINLSLVGHALARFNSSPNAHAHLIHEGDSEMRSNNLPDRNLVDHL